MSPPNAQNHDGRVAVLLVDDRKENLVALEATLRSPELRLVEAQSGEEALTRILEDDFALVVLDVFMPGMDGFEVAELMRQRERSRQTPIIFLTAVGTEMQFAQRGYQLGAVDYLTKPLDPELLQAKVAVFVELYKKREQVKQQAELLRQKERRERELAVAAERTASEQRYRFLTNAMPQIVWTARADGTVDYCNQRWIELTGLSLDELGERGWLAAVHAEDLPRCQAEWLEAVGAGAPFESECRLKRTDGSYRWHLARALPERGPDGRITAFIGTHTDIEEQKAAATRNRFLAMENERLYEEAKAAIAVKDEILAVVSHDLKNPVASIQINVDQLSRGGKREEKVLDHAHRIGRAAQRMERLINDLLDMAGLQVGNITVELRRNEVAPVIAEVIETFEPLAAEKRARLEAQPTRPGLTVYCDRLRLLQVLANLVGNAIKFMPEGGEVRITVEEEGNDVRFSIADNGPGISDEVRAHLFQPFWKGGQSRQGTGLGLYIAKGIVDRHGGRLWVDSELGRGTTFHFTLPASNAEAEKAPPATDAHP